LLAHRDLHSFPTRRSSDLLEPEQTFGKKQPFLYTQSETIYARSWIPSPDAPGIRFTYDAQVKVPKEMMALMSATNPQKKNNNGVDRKSTRLNSSHVKISYA